MGERRRGESSEPGTAFPAESEESDSLLQRAVAVLQSSYLDSTSQDGFQYSQAMLVENDLFLSELKAFARAKEAAGYSQEELQETFAFLLFDKEEEAKEVCQSGLRVNSSSISTLGDPAKGVYISKYSDCLHPRPWHHGKSGFIVICKLIKGKVRVIAEASAACPSPGYDCHVSKHGPTKSSPCQAFERSQYYVYEVSGGSAAERPRQVCPYICLACRYRDAEDAPAPALRSPAERKNRALYCPWRGQLCVRGRLLCTIALRTPYSSTIPAQLPPTLDVKHVMGLSDLKKKLPEAAFGERNYTGNEVCFQGVYSSLYEVEISNKDQKKMDQLMENLKEKDLAIIKYLRDRGVLILLTSSALAREEGLEPKEPGSLLALFLFPSPRALSPTAEKRDPKDGKGGSGKGDISLKIASVLPGLRYALRKATDSSWNSSGSTSTRIKEHLQEYAELQENSQPAPAQNGDVPDPSPLSPSEDEAAPPSQKLSERSLAQLRRYLSDPSSFTLGMSAALECLSGAGNKGARPGNSTSAVPARPDRRGKSAAPNPAPELERAGEGSPKKGSSPSKLWGQQNRRKSNRILGRNPSPLKILPGEDDSRTREAAKKKSNAASSVPKKSGSAANSNEPMLKLANLQLPHGRKRGAEVLAAEIVHKPQCEAAEKESSPPAAPGLEAKRPKTLEKPDTRKVPAAESGTKPGKSKTLKSVENRASKPPDNSQAESEREEPLSDLPSEASSQSQGAESQRNEADPVGIPSVGFAVRGDNSESHALNLLADLALGACIPPFIPKDSGTIPVSQSLPADPKEQQSLSKPKSLRVASDHKYHRAEKHGKKATSSSKASPNPPLPEKADPKHLASPSKEKTSGISGKNSGNPTPSKLQVLPPQEAPEGTEVNKHSIISAEHSYASPMPEHPRKQSNPKGNSTAGPALSKNGTGNAPAAPLVGKVLPFRHQQSETSEPSRSVAKKKEDFAKSHTVNVCGNSMKVTCRWEEEYLFHLDSRYTNNSLEKTVIRALHGPWDPNLPDDVEGMKLILHMWVALFYRKPTKLLSSSRKVVEHRSPTKVVSINSSRGFLELSDDSQDCFGFETRPADSGSDPDQTPSSSLDPSTPSQGLSQAEKSPADSQTDADGIPGAVDSTVSSSSGELPCGEEEEPSSTSCPESLSLRDDAGESVDLGDGEPEVVPEEDPHDISSVIVEEPVKDDLLDFGIAPSPSQELGCSGESLAELETENSGSQTPNCSSAPWTDPLPVPQENGKQQEEQWEAGSGSGPGPPQGGEGMGDAGEPLEVEDCAWAAGADPQPAGDSVPSEANLAGAEPGGATEEGEESQEPSEHSGKEEREVEEEKEQNEEFEDESSLQAPVDLVLSESSDAEMECDHGEQNPGNSASPEEFGAPEEEPVPSPTSLASPCPDRSTPALSDGTGTEPEGFPEEMWPNRDELPDPWDAPATPDSETNGVGVASPAEVGSPHSDNGELLSPAHPSPVHQPDSVTGNPGAAGDALGNGSEQENRDRAPSAERWEPAGSTGSLESPSGQGMALTLSPDSSSVCLTSPDGSVDPWAAPEDAPVESLQSPSQSELGRSSGFSQAGGDDADPELNSLDAEESNQGGSGVLVEEEHGSAAADGTEELGDPMGAEDGRDSPLDYTDIGDDSRAEEREDEFPEEENSPGNDTMSVETAADAPEEPEIPLHHHPLESEPSSSSWEEISAIKELPRQQQNFPNIHGDPAPASPPRAGDANPPVPAAPSRRESVLCRLWKPCREGGASQVSVATWSLDGSLNPSSSQEVLKSPRSPADEFVPAEPGSAPLSPCDPWDDPEGAEPGSPLPEAFPGMLPPSPDSARWSGSCGSPGSQAGDAEGNPGEEPVPPEDLEGGSIASPAPFQAQECSLCEPWASCEHNPEGSEAFPDPDCADTEAGEGEILASPIPASPLDEHRDPSWESPELSDAEDISDELQQEEQLPSRDGDEVSPWEDPLENSFGDSDQEYLEGNSRSPLPTRNSCIMSSVDAAGTRTNWDSSSRSSLHTEEHGEDWDRGIPADYGSFQVTRQCRERMENFQLPKRRRHRAQESPLLRSLMGTWRGLEEITQNTLDMECLRFHYKLKEILKNDKPPFSTSRSIFPKDFSAPIPLSPRSRSPLQVTIPPSDTWLGGLRSHRHRDNRDYGRARSRAASRDRGAPFHLGKLRYDRAPSDPREDVAVILDEYSQFQRVVLSRAEAGSEGPARGEAGNARVGMARPGRTATFRGMITELHGALRSHLRRVADGQPGMFYLLETGQEPFFDRVKALLKDEGFVMTEPLNFCGAQRRDSERLLVIVRNEDISSHIHSVPCLLELKCCPNVVFAGVDDPEDVTGDTFQELFQAGGFVVSDEELLERVTLGRLKEVVKVLEKLNRNGRWKWLLHHRESRKLRGDLRDDANAQKKQLLLKWCQGAELLELLHFHGCDSTAAPESQRIRCLLELQVQHIHARFAVYLTENPGGGSREILESKGILVADINTFLGTVQKVAAPFRRSYW